MRPGLAMQVWMSMLCAATHVAHRGRTVELCAFAASQAVFLTAGALEAGAEESGASFRWLLRARLASVAAIVAYAAAVSLGQTAPG